MTGGMVQDAVSGTDAHKPVGGLNRDLKLFTVLAFGLSSMGLAVSGQLPFSNIAGLWPGSSLFAILIVALIACLFHAYTYVIIGSVAPRSGADYYLARRVLPAPLAFASSWTFVIFSALMAGAVITMIPQKILPIFFRMFGMVGQRVPAMIRLADQVNTPDNVVLISTAFVVVTFLLILLPPRIVMYTLQAGFVLILAAWGAILYSLLSSTATDFPIAWDRVMGPGSFLGHLILAKDQGMNPEPGNYTLLAGLFVSFWLFYGYSAPASIAGEIKRPERSLLIGSLLALALVWGIFLASSVLMFRIVPADWLAAESFLYLSKNTTLSMPWIIFYAVVLRPNPVFMVFLFVAWIYSIVNMAQTFFYHCSRVMLSWAEDSLLPETLGYIHPGLRSPLMAVLAVATLAECGVVLASIQDAAILQLSFVFFIVGSQLVPVLAVTLFPFLQREWFESSSPLVRIRIGGLPVITLVGAITFVYLIWLLVSSVLTRVPGSTNPGTMMFFLVIFLTGLAWYLFRVLSLKAHAARAALKKAAVESVKS